MSNISKVRDNFNRIARDLDRAIRIGRFSEVQRFLIDEARELCWSFAGDDARPFVFNFAEMGRRSVHVRQTFSAHCGVLIRCRIFTSMGDGSLLINKDYTAWTNEDGSPRLTKEEIAWCLSVAQKGRSVAPRRRNGLNDCNAPSSPDDTPCRAAARHPLSSPDDTVQMSPQTPVEEARASEEQERVREKSVEPAGACEDGEPKGDPEPPYPDEDGPLYIHQGVQPIDHARSRQVWSLLWRAFRNPRLSNGYFEHQRWYPADCWDAAIREAVRRGVTPTTIRYVETIAASYAANGIPAEATPPTVAPRNAGAPRPAPLPPLIANTGPRKRDRGRPSNNGVHE